MSDALVIGAGPAGLMAAEVMARAGLSVTVADRMPSPARKFLMAGKSGLNLTKVEGAAAFRAAYGDALPPALDQALAAFGPEAIMDWAEGLGQPLFTGSTGRVFPKAMKASPLLRAWLTRLDGLGVVLRRRWTWRGWARDGAALFDTPDGPQAQPWRVAIFAMGGASWPRLGSDGAWYDQLSQVTPFQPSNMGVLVDWSAPMHRHFGRPVKGVAFRAGALRSRGECVVTKRGLEGGGIYEVSWALREDGAVLHLDLLPDITEDAIRARLSKARPKQSRSEILRKTLRLDPVKIALVYEAAAGALPNDLAPMLKDLRLPIAGPFPMEGAISTAGGLRFDALNDQLMFHTRPGLFAAGEMLDWDAPTGGYLLTACLATGAWAGRHAAAFATLDQAP